MVKIVT